MTNISEITNNGYNVNDSLKNKSYEEIVRIYNTSSLPFAVATFNVKGSLNTGNILRTACCYAASRFFCIGARRFDRRSCVGSQHYIPMSFLETEPTPKELRNYLADFGFYPMFIEQGGVDIDSFEAYDVSDFHLKPCLIFGSESDGIDPSFLVGLGNVYTIPQYGVMRSLNVSSAAAIAINTVAKKIVKQIKKD